MNMRIIACALLGPALLFAAGTARAVDWLNPFHLFGGGEEFVIWQDTGQYVKIVDQDKFQKYKHAPGNRHPASLNPSDVAVVLSSLQTRGGEGAGASKGAASLFTTAEVALLAPKLADAITKVKPDQDVIFAVSDINTKAGSNARLSTAGRVFVNDNGLNLILGDSFQPAGSASGVVVDHTEAPYRPGRRREALDTAGEVAAGPGLSFASGGRNPRYDWVMIDMPTVVAAYRGPRVPLATAPALTTTPATTADTSAAPEDTAKLLQERQQMREEMARMRRQLDEKNATGAPATVAVPESGRGATTIPEGTRSTTAEAAPSPAAAPAAAAGAAPARSESKGAAAGNSAIEQRLDTLQSLHEKKLITDQEYAAKRKKILEEL